MTTRALPRYLRLLTLLALPAFLVTACDDSGTGGNDDDDTTSGDDDDAGDDDMWADDDDAADDDTADDDDAAAGDACTVVVGPEGMTIELTGTCGEDPAGCDGGYDMMNPTGSCEGGLTCCIHDDQCETAMMGTCAETEDECEGEPPPDAPGFPMMGCPSETPVCCIPEPPR